jgi:hypothetical protein
MTVVRVNPASVQAYGADAQDKFNQIRTELTALVDAVVQVRYFGPNAVDFKTRAGQLASEFANNLNKDLGAVAEAIRVSTSNIAASLGGQPLSIVVNGSPIAPPAVQTVDYVDVDTAALDGLKANVNQHFAAINALIDGHMSKLQGTDWTGNAKDQAVSSVSSFTSSAKAKADESQQSLNNYITNQVQSTVAADR